MAIRVLRLIEYVYKEEERAMSDMSRWTHGHRDASMIMRSATLPFEAVDWTDRVDTYEEVKQMFPGAHAEVYYNEAGEPLGWDNRYYDEPEYDPDDFLEDDDDGND